MCVWSIQVPSALQCGQSPCPCGAPELHHSTHVRSSFPSPAQCPVGHSALSLWSTHILPASVLVSDPAISRFIILSGTFCWVLDPREPLLGSRNDIKRGWRGCYGHLGWWHQATGTRRVVRGWEAWPSSEFPSAGNRLHTKQHRFGWGWQGQRQGRGSLAQAQSLSSLPFPLPSLPTWLCKGQSCTRGIPVFCGCSV